MTGEDDKTDECGSTSNPQIGRDTMQLVLEQIEKANKRSAATSAEAMDSIIKSNASSNQRIFLIVLSLLLLFGAILGIATTVEIPGFGTIGVDPGGEEVAEP